MKIKENILTLIRNSKICKAKLQIALDKSAPTIQRYLDDNDIMLTTKVAIDVIVNEFSVSPDEILTDETMEMELQESDVNVEKSL